MSSKNRSFASMSPERRRALAIAGGRAAQACGRAHRFTPEEAARAGRLGGNAVSQDREHMVRIGGKDGKTPKRHGVPEEDGSQSRRSV